MITINDIKNKFPLIGDHVFLIIFSEENITSEYLEWLNDPSVVKYSKQRQFKHSRDSALIFYQSYTASKLDIFIAIHHTESRAYIGTMTLNFSNDFKIAEIRIFIGNKIFWGKGFGFDAWNTTLNWLLNEVGVEKVQGGALESNFAMIKIMENAKMSLQTFIEDYDFIDGTSQRALIFSKMKGI